MDKTPEGVVVIGGVEYVTPSRAGEMLGVLPETVLLQLPRIEHVTIRHPGGIMRYLLVSESVLEYKRTRKRGRPARLVREAVEA